MRAISSIVLSIFAVVPVRAQESSKVIAARVELHAVSSLTLFDQQFLNGDANGKSVTVTGEFRWKIV